MAWIRMLKKGDPLCNQNGWKKIDFYKVVDVDENHKWADVECPDGAVRRMSHRELSDLRSRHPNVQVKFMCKQLY